MVRAGEGDVAAHGFVGDPGGVDHCVGVGGEGAVGVLVVVGWVLGDEGAGEAGEGQDGGGEEHVGWLFGLVVLDWKNRVGFELFDDRSGGGAWWRGWWAHCRNSAVVLE